MTPPEEISATEAYEKTCKRSCAILHFVIYGTTGLVLGILLSGLLAWLFMPTMMLTMHKSKYASVDETCTALKDSITSAGWVCPAIRNMNASMAKQGIEFSGEVRLVELCKANYAQAVLETNPEVSTLMPCAFGVYKGADGAVYISGMNMGLMGKMFGGRIAEIMGSKVAHDEHRILAPVIKKKKNTQRRNRNESSNC